MPDQVLCFGRDEMLLKTRMWLLKKHAPVAVAANYTTFSELVEKGSYQVAILCHTLTPEERQQAMQLLTRVSQETKIVCLTPASGGNWNDVPVDGEFISVEGSAISSYQSCCSALTRFSGSCSPSGRVMRNIVPLRPLRVLLRAAMVPRCPSTIDFEIARPRPVPRSPLVVKKGSNRHSGSLSFRSGQRERDSGRCSSSFCPLNLNSPL